MSQPIVLFGAIPFSSHNFLINVRGCRIKFNIAENILHQFDDIPRSSPGVGLNVFERIAQPERRTSAHISCMAFIKWRWRRANQVQHLLQSQIRRVCVFPFVLMFDDGHIDLEECGWRILDFVFAIGANCHVPQAFLPQVAVSQ
jgi:hypothetical protein